MTFSNGNADFNNAGSDSLRQNLTCACHKKPKTLNEKESEEILISNSMTQVLKSPNKSTMISDSINNYSLKNEEKKRDSENHALLNVNLERDEVVR